MSITNQSGPEPPLVRARATDRTVRLIIVGIIVAAFAITLIISHSRGDRSLGGGTTSVQISGDGAGSSGSSGDVASTLKNHFPLPSGATEVVLQNFPATQRTWETTASLSSVVLYYQSALPKLGVTLGSPVESVDQRGWSLTNGSGLIVASLQIIANPSIAPAGHTVIALQLVSG